MTHCRSILLALALGCACPATLPATLIFNEEFQTGVGAYTAGANVQGQNPAVTGFTGAWAGSDTSSFQVSGTNVAMPGVTNGGGSLGMSTLAAASSRSDSRAVSAYTAAGTYWFSSVFTPDADAVNGANGSTMFVGFLSGALSTVSSGGSTAALWTSSNGADLEGFAWGIEAGSLRVRYQTGADTVATQNLGSLSLTAGSTYLLIAELQVNTAGNDVLNLWVTSSAPGSQAGLGAATATLSTFDLVSTGDAIDTLVLFAGRSASTDGAVGWDAIRMGTQFSDLAIVPEPSAYLLLVLSATSWGLARRRRAP
jgi:hypothetical protein